jgi:hypothetical protein
MRCLSKELMADRFSKRSFNLQKDQFLIESLLGHHTGVFPEKPPKKRCTAQRFKKEFLWIRGWILVLDRRHNTMLISHPESVRRGPHFESEILGSTISYSCSSAEKAL